MWPVAAPLVMHMHGYLRGVATVRIYPYPALCMITCFIPTMQDYLFYAHNARWYVSCITQDDMFHILCKVTCFARVRGVLSKKSNQSDFSLPDILIFDRVGHKRNNLVLNTQSMDKVSRKYEYGATNVSLSDR